MTLPSRPGHRPGLVRRLGYLVDPLPRQQRSERLYRPLRAIHEAPLPDDILLKADALVPILDQGSEGACSGHAAAEADFLSELRTDPQAVMGSRQWYYRCGRVVDGTVDRDAGTHYRSVFTQAAVVGVPPESAWPYEPKSGDPDGDGSAADQFRHDPPAELVRLAFDRRNPGGALEASSVDDLEGDLSDNVDHALSLDMPVCWGGDVDDAFCRGEIDPAVPVTYPAKPAGAHAMVIVGRKVVRANGSAARWYRLRNSWGADFADGGRFWMAESYMRTGDLWVVDKPPPWGPGRAAAAPGAGSPS